MVFSSVPLYPDPPHWNQQQQQQQQQQESTNKVLNEHNMHVAPLQASSSPSQTNTCRPVTMSERAKLAKIPQAEAALKCPRCDSNNTKFCYFNNYSLTQPRHFCKTCRRYWTRGGALRSVPVGGGCRRNKRGNNKPSSSKSSAPVTPVAAPNAQPVPFLAPWHHLHDYGFGGIQQQIEAAPESMGLEQWRIQQIQQFPFLGGVVPEATAMMVPGLYPFEEHGKIMPSVKMEESSTSQVVRAAAAADDSSASGVNFPRQFFNMGEHLSGFSSSSNGNFL